MRVAVFRIVLIAVLLLGLKSDARLSTKRGYATENTTDQYWLLNASWYYNWMRFPSPTVTTLPFTPMYWNSVCLTRNASDPQFWKYCCRNGTVSDCVGLPENSTHVLGFNEPDLAIQSNMSVDEALAAWPRLVHEAKKVGAEVGSPAMAGDPVTGSWFPQFMSAVNDTIDFTTLHWYKGGNATLFIDDVKALIAAYGKPVWVTEFSLQWGDLPYKFTQAEVIAFLKEVLTFLDEEPMVHRYYFFDVQVGTCAVFYPNGTLTPVGEFYATFAPSVASSPPSSNTAKIVAGVIGGGFALAIFVFVVLDIRKRRQAAQVGAYHAL